MASSPTGCGAKRWNRLVWRAMVGAALSAPVLRAGVGCERSFDHLVRKYKALTWRIGPQILELVQGLWPHHGPCSRRIA